MKKKILCSGLLMLSCIFAVNSHGQSLGFDRHISAPTNLQTTAPDMAIAFDGRIFNAFCSGNGIVIKVSEDHGKSWQPFQTLSLPGYRYDAPSIIVTGNSAGTLTLFVAGIRRAIQGSEQSVFVRKYKADNRSLISEPLLESNMGEIYACDLAYGYTATDNEPTISLLYAASAGNRNVILQKTSFDGGASFEALNIVAVSKAYFRNVSICFGKSNSASNGRYFMAWDEYATPKAAWGKVYTSRNTASIHSSTIVPVRVDNADPQMAGRLRRPVLAVSDIGNNDSASCTALLLAEYNREGGTISVAGFSNQRSHFTSYWQPMPVAENGTQPVIAFDPATQSFALSYYDAKEKSMQLLKTDYRLRSSEGWQSVVTNYADNNILDNPRPCIAIDPLYHQAAMSWAAPGNAICFDAEYNQAPSMLQEIGAVNEGLINKISWTAGAAIDEGTVVLERSTDNNTFMPLATLNQKGHPFVNSYEDTKPEKGINYYRVRFTAGTYSDAVSAYADAAGQANLKAYPNPATNYLHIATADAAANATVSLYDINGRRSICIPASIGLTAIDISNLPAGAYLVQYDNGSQNKSTRITKVAL